MTEKRLITEQFIVIRWGPKQKKWVYPLSFGPKTSRPYLHIFSKHENAESFIETERMKVGPAEHYQIVTLDLPDPPDVSRERITLEEAIVLLSTRQLDMADVEALVEHVNEWKTDKQIVDKDRDLLGPETSNLVNLWGRAFSQGFHRGRNSKNPQ